MGKRRTLLAAAAAAAFSPIFSGPVQARPKRHATAPKPAASDDTDGDSAAVPASPAQTPIGPLDTPARWAVIVDDTTGASLLEKAADESMPPSSLTKLMTAYIVFGKLKQGQLHLEQSLPVSEKAWRMQGSKMFVPLGAQVPVEDLIRGMITQSGNDACIVLAEGVAGSEDQFVALMNKQAAQLGMSHSQFRNCTGWPDPDHHMSVRDIATLAHHLIHDFPEYYRYFSEKDYKFNNISQGNRNVLVDKGLADGLKTGHTDAGGFGLCASSDHGGNRIILVVNGLPSSKARVEEGERLLAWAFSNFENVTLFRRGETVETVKVWLGAQPTVPLAVAHDVVMTLPHGWRSKVKITLDYDAPLAAPIVAGQQVARLVVEGPDPAARQEIPVVAATSVTRLGLPSRAVAVLSHYVTGG